MNENGNCSTLLASLTWPCQVEIIDLIYYDKCTPFRAKIELGRVCWKFFTYLSGQISTLSLLDCDDSEIQKHLNSKYCIFKKIRFLKVPTNRVLGIGEELMDRLASTIETMTIQCRGRFALGAIQPPSPDATAQILQLTSSLANLKQLRFWVSPYSQLNFDALFQGFPVGSLEGFKLFSIETRDMISSIDYDSYLFSSNPTKLREYRGVLSANLADKISPYLNNLTKMALLVPTHDIAEPFINTTLPMLKNLNSLRLTVKAKSNQVAECLNAYLTSDNNRLEHLHIVGYVQESDTLLTTITNMSKLKTLSIPAKLIIRPVRLNLSKLTIYKPSLTNQLFIDESSMVKRIIIKDNEGDTPLSIYSYLKNNIYLQHIKEVIYNERLIKAIKDKPQPSCLKTIEVKVPYSLSKVKVDLIIASIAQCSSICNVRLSLFERVDVSKVFSGFKFFGYSGAYQFLKIE